MGKPALKDRVPTVHLEYNAALHHDQTITSWKAGGRTGLVDPDTPIVKEVGLAHIRRIIKYFQKQIEFAESDYSKWGRRKVGKPE